MNQQTQLHVHIFRHVHGAGADAHDHTGVVFKQFPQADLVEKGILGGHMAAGQNDQVTFQHQFLRFIGIVAVQHRIVAEGHTDLGKDLENIRTECAV